MTCDERQELLLLYVACALDTGEREELRAHLASGCQTCAANLVEAQETWAAMATALDPLEPPAVAKQYLMNKIAGRSDRLPDNLAIRLFRIFVPAAVAAGIAIIITHAVLSRQVNALQRESSAEKMLLGYQDQQINSLKTSLSKQQEIAQMLLSPHAKLIDLDPTNLQPGASACIVWDKKSQHWELITTGMACAPTGKTYELWFVTKAGQKIPACTFDVDSKGDTNQLVTVPADIGPLAMAAVTDEPDGGMPQPTGHFQLTGKIQ